MYCTRHRSFVAGERCLLVAGHIGSCPTCSMPRQPKEEDGRARNFLQSQNFRSKRRCHASIVVNTSLHGHKAHNSLGLITPDQRLESSNTSNLSVPSHSDRPSRRLYHDKMFQAELRLCFPPLGLNERTLILLEDIQEFVLHLEQWQCRLLFLFGPPALILKQLRGHHQNNPSFRPQCVTMPN
jgi:hypothetical protein